MTTRLDTVRDSDGKLPAYAWPGGYPVTYLTADGETLCPACANGENGAEPFDATDGRDLLIEERQWAIVAADVYWEGPPLTCAHCGAPIESAYGDPEAETEEEN